MTCETKCKAVVRSVGVCPVVEVGESENAEWEEEELGVEEERLEETMELKTGLLDTREVRESEECWFILDDVRLWKAWSSDLNSVF